MKPSRSQSGFSLVEMLIYVTILTIVILSLINIVSSFSRSYQQLGALRSAENTGLETLERMERDIHAASSIDTSNSTFNTSPGVLTVTTSATTTKFYVTNGEMRIDVNGSFIGPLSMSSAKVTSLIFKNLTTSKSQAVKIDMTVDGTVGSVTRTKKFHTTIILKNS